VQPLLSCAACLKVRVIAGAFADHSAQFDSKLNICEVQVLILDMVMCHSVRVASGVSEVLYSLNIQFLVFQDYSSTSS
jgi:hypothetical protein